MFLFCRTQRVSRKQIYIPYATRAALGIHNGCQVGLSRVEDDEGLLCNQFVLSPVPFSKRSDLWNLRISFRDRPGIISEMTDLLKSQNIDVLRCSAGTRDHHHSLVMDLDFDAQLYASDYDLTTEERKTRMTLWPKELYARIVSHFISDIEFRTDEKPDIYLKRNHVLSRSVGTQATHERCKLKDGWLQLPDSQLESLQENYEELYPNLKNLGPRARDLHACFFTDIQSRTIAITCFYKNTGHIHIRVAARNRVGALSAVTREIKAHDFNILQAYSRNARDRDESLTDLMLQFPPQLDRIREDKKLRSYLHGIFRTESLQGFECKLTFPPRLTKAEIERDAGRKL